MQGIFNRTNEKTNINNSFFLIPNSNDGNYHLGKTNKFKVMILNNASKFRFTQVNQGINLVLVSNNQ
jgi:hypothetical protein